MSPEQLATELRTPGIAALFAVVYLGMFLGGLPRVKLDRTGVALLGAIAMIALTGMSLEEAARAVDLPTLVLLFSFMVVSAQMRLGGFYTAVTQRMAIWPLQGAGLLGAMLTVAAVLSAIFSNDVICLAMTPLVIRLCQERGLDPVRTLVGLACAANIGSAVTLIGNPQNMLIGSVLQLPFGGYLQAAWLPVVLSLVGLWAWLSFGPGTRAGQLPHVFKPATNATMETEPPVDRFEMAKGVVVATSLMVIFLFTDWDRDVAALVGAGVLLLSRRLHSAEVMGTVDWQLLLLFIGLFIVNHAFQETGMAAAAVQQLAQWDVHLHQPATLLVLGSALSNLVSNVPAVMLLLPHLPPPPDNQAAGMLLALASTFAGNLLLVGSIANLIVVGLAEKAGIHIDWKQHARIGLPVTGLSLAFLWLCWSVLGTGASASAVPAP